MTPPGDARVTPARNEAAAALERHITQLIALADRHSAAGRITSARNTRALILVLNDELDDLHAGC